MDIGIENYIADYLFVNDATIGKFSFLYTGFKSGFGDNVHNHITCGLFLYSNLNYTPRSIYNRYENIQIDNNVWLSTNVFIKGKATKLIKIRRFEDHITALKKFALWLIDKS